MSVQLAELNKQYEVAYGEQMALKTNADLMKKRLDAASQLISGLGSEHARWSKELEELALDRVKLLGDCLLASSFLRSVTICLSSYNHLFLCHSLSRSLSHTHTYMHVQ